MRVSNRILKIVKLGELMPRGYGLAWRDPSTDESVFLPIPINLIARLWREIHYRVKVGITKTTFEKQFDRRLHEEYRAGWNRGFEEGKGEIRASEAITIH